MRLRVDAHSPIPIRWQLTEQLKHVIEGNGVPREQALPSIRELAGFLGINPNTVARAIEDLKRSGHVEARRGKGGVCGPRAARPPVPDSPRGLSEGRGDPRGGPRDDPRRRGGGRPESVVDSVGGVSVASSSFGGPRSGATSGDRASRVRGTPSGRRESAVRTPF
jgi:DNA-binding transcriptional MocR family regulator